MKSGHDRATKDVTRVLKEYRGQEGVRPALQAGVQTAGANTSTGQAKARLAMVLLAKSLYLPAQTQGQRTTLLQKMNFLSAWKQMTHLIFLSWPLVQKPTGFNYINEKALRVDKKTAVFLQCVLSVSSIKTGKLKASHHLIPLLCGRWNIFWNSMRTENWPRKSAIGTQIQWEYKMELNELKP